MSDRSITDRLKHAWNVFRNEDAYDWRQWKHNWQEYASSSRNEARHRLRMTTEKNLVASVYNRIAIDVSEMTLKHVRTNENGRFQEVIKSDLHYILNTEANIDQASKAFVQDIVLSMFDEGAVAVVPVDTDVDPKQSASYKIGSMRTARIVEWFPRHVRINIYNDRTGQHEERMVPKNIVAIIENPLHSIMNEPNSILKRLIHKLNLLDAVDNIASSGKLDVIIQLPYSLKSEQKRAEAVRRREEMEMQLSSSKYGIAYSEATERVIQLNRPVENTLMTQVQYLQGLLWSQLGLTEDVFNGKADEATMINYDNRTLLPIIHAILDEFNRKFLSKTARTQGQLLMAFRDPFKLVTATALADLSDKLTRNEILSSNEVRGEIGFMPSDDPRADELRNKNLNAQNDQLPKNIPNEGGSSIQENQNGSET